MWWIIGGFALVCVVEFLIKILSSDRSESHTVQHYRRDKDVDEYDYDNPSDEDD